MRVALIGSRELEKNPKYADDIALCSRVCFRLAQLGLTFTSGLCELGMDAIAQRAYSKALSAELITEKQFEVYVKDERMKHRSNLPNKYLSRIAPLNMRAKAEELAASVHPAWQHCNEWARGQHARNAHQIFGANLDNPVDFVVTWTPEGKIQGGTATAINLALKNGIPVFNLGVKDKETVIHKIKEFLILRGVLDVEP